MAVFLCFEFEHGHDERKFALNAQELLSMRINTRCAVHVHTKQMHSHAECCSSTAYCHMLRVGTPKLSTPFNCTLGRRSEARAPCSSFPNGSHYSDHKYQSTERDKEHAGPPALPRRVYETHALDAELVAAGQQRRAHVAVPGH